MGVADVFFGWYTNMLGVPSCDRKTQYDGNKKYPNQILAVDAAIQTYDYVRDTTLRVLIGIKLYCITKIQNGDNPMNLYL
jgi:hypothetical protein